MGDTIQLAILLFAASWILSMFLGAGPKGLVRAIGTALAALALFIAQIISAVVTILMVIGSLLLLYGAYRFLRWLIFGPQPNRRRRRNRHFRGRHDYYDDPDPYWDNPYNNWRD